MRRTLTAITAIPGALGAPLVLVLLGLLALVVTGCGPAASEAGPDVTTMVPTSVVVPVSAGARVDTVTCGADERGVRADGTITNVTDTPAAYEFTVAFLDRSDQTYATAVVRTPVLAPVHPQTEEQVFVWEAVPDVPPAAGGHCEVVDGVVVAEPIEENG